MSNRSPLATIDKPSTTHTPAGERAQCRDRTSRRDARRTAGRETKEDDVSGHVRGENVAKAQKADRINEAGDDRQADERSNERRLIIHDAGSRVHEFSPALCGRGKSLWVVEMDRTELHPTGSDPYTRRILLRGLSIQ